MTKQPSIAIIAGARPNFMKVAPLVRELKKQKMRHFLVNTGQHFSKNMADDFLKEFNLKPDYTLKPSHTSSKEQMHDIKAGLAKIFKKEEPRMVIVVGDVNATLWAAQVAKKMRISLGHVEAGLRSFNNKMPEEHNRIQTDRLSDLLFVTQEEGVKNLKREGITGCVHFVGNIMIDTLKLFIKKAKKVSGKYYFCTLHRTENVDSKKVFSEIIAALEVIAEDAIIYLPLHPRTKKMAQKFGLTKKLKVACHLLPPLSYARAVSYLKHARLVLTDSGGVQEETSYLGIPCLTLRTETERPITVTSGTNIIGGVAKRSILKAYHGVNFKKRTARIKYWDGKTSARIVSIIKKQLHVR
ncbi:MAG: UDP-N-acetylglucosamine 2-epimerase (non-hydrolyzing) [Parcubacteria group bacterium]|nr:UDP-N-acetylglucosamine 2-epimerase (non-hydrolyzing) [Parcubacteria group bacterium]